MRATTAMLASGLFLTQLASSQVHLNFGAKLNRQITPPEMAALQEQANNGDPEAQFEVGNYYFFGIGQKKDVSTAVHWWERAAKQKLPDALRWYAKVVDDGAADLHREIAWDYSHGINAPKNEQLAAKWTKTADEDSAPPIP